MNTKFIQSLLMRGFTLIELLVVIAIIGLLASMAYPAYLSITSGGDFTYDQNNMRQIHQLMLSDRMTSRQTWAFPRGNSNFTLPSMQQPQINKQDSNDTGIDVTNISLFTIAARNKLSPDLFNSPVYDRKFEHIANFEGHAESTWTVSQIANWASPETADLNITNLPYAFDWSTPKSAGSTRVVFGMRDPTAYTDGIPVVYADGHGGRMHYDLEQNRVVNTAVTPLDADGNGKGGLTPDNIYDEIGDIDGTDGKKRHLWFARGNATRTSLK